MPKRLKRCLMVTFETAQCELAHVFGALARFGRTSTQPEWPERNSLFGMQLAEIHSVSFACQN